MNCALCHRPLTHPSWRSEVLGASYHESCYETALVLKEIEGIRERQGFHIEITCTGLPTHAPKPMEEIAL